MGLIEVQIKDKFAKKALQNTNLRVLSVLGGEKWRLIADFQDGGGPDFGLF